MNSAKQEKIAGIIGGMGPEATVDLMQRIIRNTPALGDADHIRCIVDNNPKIPSRMKALLENSGENPGAEMAAMGRRLETWGADFLAIPCNTAHNYLPDVVQAVRIPVLDMVDLAVQQARRQKSGLRCAGILATPMVRITKLYENKFTPYGVTVVYAQGEDEQNLFRIIKEVKAGHVTPALREELLAIKQNMLGQGAEVCILACTELGILVQEDENTLDAAEVLAREIVRIAKGE